MTLTAEALGLYAIGLVALSATPGPVVVALVARAVTGGFRAALPLAVGVMVGDLLWPLVAMAGLSGLVLLNAGVLTALRWFGAAFFVWMGIELIRGGAFALKSGGPPPPPGMLAAFLAGLLAIIGNPKAILFYVGSIPLFFTVETMTLADMAVVCLMSVGIAFLGNLVWAGFAARAGAFLKDPVATARVNTGAGVALILVGVAITLL